MLYTYITHAVFSAVVLINLQLADFRLIWTLIKNCWAFLRFFFLSRLAIRIVISINAVHPRRDVSECTEVDAYCVPIDLMKMKRSLNDQTKCLQNWTAFLSFFLCFNAKTINDIIHVHGFKSQGGPPKWVFALTGWCSLRDVGFFSTRIKSSFLFTGRSSKSLANWNYFSSKTILSSVNCTFSKS